MQCVWNMSSSRGWWLVAHWESPPGSVCDEDAHARMRRVSSPREGGALAVVGHSRPQQPARVTAALVISTKDRAAAALGRTPMARPPSVLRA